MQDLLTLTYILFIRACRLWYISPDKVEIRLQSIVKRHYPQIDVTSLFYKEFVIQLLSRICDIYKLGNIESFMLALSPRNAWQYDSTLTVAEQYWNPDKKTIDFRLQLLISIIAQSTNDMFDELPVNVKYVDRNG